MPFDNPGWNLPTAITPEVVALSESLLTDYEEHLHAVHSEGSVFRTVLGDWFDGHPLDAVTLRCYIQSYWSFYAAFTNRGIFVGEIAFIAVRNPYADHPQTCEMSRTTYEYNSNSISEWCEPYSAMAWTILFAENDIPESDFASFSDIPFDDAAPMVVAGIKNGRIARAMLDAGMDVELASSVG